MIAYCFDVEIGHMDFMKIVICFEYLGVRDFGMGSHK